MYSFKPVRRVMAVFSIKPLTFDRVNHGWPLNSSLPLFRLPVELLNHVTPYLGAQDLAALALVDRNCRQLARSVQFMTVKLDFSKAAIDLLNHLKNETSVKSAASGPRIGVCIRHLIVAEDCSSYPCLEDLMAFTNDEIKHYTQMTKETELTYVDALYTIIGQSLPHLHILEWQRTATMTPDLLKCILSSPVTHLKLHRIRDTLPWPDDQPEQITSRRSLETLSVRIIWSYRDIVANAGSCLHVLLREAAPTLHELAWLGGSLTRPKSLAKGGFANTRNLVLNCVNLDGDALKAFLASGSRINSLSLDTSGPDVVECFGQLGTIPSLMNFRWTKCEIDDLAIIVPFLRSNPQLKSFEVTFPLPTLYIDEAVVPALRELHHLVALNLTWDANFIPQRSLDQLRAFKTLQHLQLSARKRGSWCYGWEIDHQAIHEVLSPLRCLKSLAFDRDSYRVQSHSLLGASSNVQDYYFSKALPQDVNFACYLTDAELATLSQEANIDAALSTRRNLWELAWERWHKSCMTTLALRYAKCFQNLTWCHIGQLSMTLQSSVDMCEVLGENPSRDHCSAFLEQRWSRTIRAQ